MLQSVEPGFQYTQAWLHRDFASDRADVIFNRPILSHLVWSTSPRIGLAHPFANSRVPLSEAFLPARQHLAAVFPRDGAGPQRQVQFQFRVLRPTAVHPVRAEETNL